MHIAFRVWFELGVTFRSTATTIRLSEVGDSFFRQKTIWGRIRSTSEQYYPYEGS